MSGSPSRRLLRFCLIASFLIIPYLSNRVLGLPSGVAQAAGTTTVIVHYHRFAGDYGAMDTTTGWNLWMWPYMPNNLAGAAYAFDSTDAFGEVAHAQVPGSNTEVGIIVRLANFAQKDVSQDRFVQTPNQQAEIWLIQGDPGIYTSAADANAALASAGKPKPVAAFLDGPSTVTVSISHAITLTSASTIAQVKDLDTNQVYTVTGTQDLSGSTTGMTNLVDLQLSGSPDVTHRLELIDQAGVAIPLPARDVLDDPQYVYNGTLGAIYSPKSTDFKLWAPVATKVTLLTYTDESGDGAAAHPMTRGDHGLWSTTLTGDQKGLYYLYQVTNYGNAATVVDPYADNIAVNGKYGQVVDLKATDPKGWASDHYVKLARPTDASLYEVHVRDFSIDPNSGMKHRGKYLAFTENNTKGPHGVATGVASLKQLGITHVELLPIQGCNSLDEILGGSTAVAPKGDGTRYNWCYDPRNFNAPNGAYATNPHGTSRITEVKKMVQALHRQHLGVILDVVYNHTPNTSIFDPIVPGYYYRTDNTGAIESNSCCPDLASERTMVLKFIIDSTSYWMREYHIDGFRFDLMTLLGTKAVKAISTALHKINPNTIILGEPWDLGEKIQGDVQLTKGTQKGLGVAVFNDDIRNGVEGNVFTASQPGYATGNPAQQTTIEKQIVGNIAYNSQLSGWAGKPDEVINYESSHDNNTLWDRIAVDAAAQNVTEATKIRMDELANAIVFTSQGVPFLQGGEEFLRTKGGDSNSYQGGDVENELNWARKATYIKVFNYYANLIHFRAAHPAFRLDSQTAIQQHLTFLNSPQQSIEYELSGHANKDPWKNIIVIYNPNATAISASLPKGKWNIVATAGSIGEKTLGHASGSVPVPDYSMEILYR